MSVYASVDFRGLRKRDKSRTKNPESHYRSKKSPQRTAARKQTREKSQINLRRGASSRVLKEAKRNLSHSRYGAGKKSDRRERVSNLRSRRD